MEIVGVMLLNTDYFGIYVHVHVNVIFVQRGFFAGGNLYSTCLIKSLCVFDFSAE